MINPDGGALGALDGACTVMTAGMQVVAELWEAMSDYERRVWTETHGDNPMIEAALKVEKWEADLEAIRDLDITNPLPVPGAPF